MRKVSEAKQRTTPRSAKPRPAAAKEAVQTVALDKIDRRILAKLQHNNRISNLALAEATNLSPPSCLRRVRRLREEGVIMADVALVNPAAVGRNLFVFVEVILERQTEALQQEFEQSMRHENDVMQCYMIAGEIDYLVVVQTVDIHTYHSFARRVLTNNTNIRKFQSHFAMHRSVFKTALELSSD